MNLPASVRRVRAVHVVPTLVLPADHRMRMAELESDALDLVVLPN